MAPLPKPTASTVRAIYKAYEDRNEQRDGKTIPASQIADECARKLFYDFRWTTPHEAIPGRTLRLFETGSIEEERWVENLRMIGCEVVDRAPDGRQIRVDLAGGHVGGYLDSEILGLPEAPTKWHVGEMKSHNLKSFTELKKKGVKEAKPLHYGQMQMYCHARGRDRAIYLATCKDNDELYAERIHYDVEYCLRLLARAERIIAANEPPARLSEKPDFYACNWCKHKPICHEDAWPRAHCRTCLHSTPIMDGNAGWDCSRWNKPLGLAEQDAGCPAHLYIPSLLSAYEQVDADPDAETISYRHRLTGKTWVDGASNDSEEAA